MLVNLMDKERILIIGRNEGWIHEMGLVFGGKGVTEKEREREKENG